MSNMLNVKSIPLQYGDCVVKCHKILNYENATSYVSQFHSHMYYECHFIKKGEAVFRTAEKSITISDSQMLIIPPSFSHFSLKGCSGEKHASFEFSMNRIESQPKGVFSYMKKVFDNAVLKPMNVSSNLIENIKKFENLSVDTIGEYLKCVTLLTGVFSELFDECVKGHSVKDFFVETTDFETLLDVCLTIPDMNMNEIANVTAYPRRNLSRKLQKYYGMPLSYLRDRGCVKTAMELLENTDATIEQIAQDSGFKSANAMRTKFKKHADITPNEYRKLKNKNYRR